MKVFAIYGGSGKASEAARELRLRGFEVEVLGGLWGARLFVAATGDNYVSTLKTIDMVVRHILPEAVELDHGLIDY